MITFLLVIHLLVMCLLLVRIASANKVGEEQVQLSYGYRNVIRVDTDRGEDTLGALLQSLAVCAL